MPGVGHLPSSCPSEVSWTPGTIQTIVLALVCPSELDGKATAEDTVHLHHKHGAIKLVLTRLAPHVLPEGALQTAEGQGHQQFYPAPNPVNANNYQHGRLCPGCNGSSMNVRR